LQESGYRQNVSFLLEPDLVGLNLGILKFL
jgi:hypothetical protein